MPNDKFLRLLDEALATTVGGGIDAPTDTYGDDDDDDDFQPTPQIINALYRWVVDIAPIQVLQPITAALEEATPNLYTSSIQVKQPAGHGTLNFNGTAKINGSWKIDESDPSYVILEHSIRTTLLKSDLWKVLGVDYKLASKYLDNQTFITHAFRAMAFKLNNANHAAYWMHLLKGEATQQATAQLTDYINKSPAQVLQGAHQLAKRGMSVKLVPGSLRVSPTGKATNIMKGAIPQAKMASGGHFYHVAEFVMGAQLEFLFMGRLDIGGEDQMAVVHALVQGLEMAWEEFSEDFEVELNAPDFDPEWYPQSYNFVVADWSSLFDDPDEADESALKSLSNPSPQLLHLVKRTVDCTRNSRGAREYDVSVEATLSLGGIDISGSSLVLTVVVDDVSVD